jgi:hypothetical protein
MDPRGVYELTCSELWPSVYPRLSCLAPALRGCRIGRQGVGTSRSERVGAARLEFGAYGRNVEYFGAYGVALGPQGGLWSEGWPLARCGLWPENMADGLVPVVRGVCVTCVRMI